MVATAAGSGFLGFAGPAAPNLMTTAQCHYFTEPQPGEVLVAIWPKGHDDLASAIRGITHGRGVHAAFVRASGNIIENFYPRVRERGWNPGERGLVELYRMAGSTPDDWARLESWFSEQLSNPPPYSIGDLFRYAFNMKPKPGPACFCSMFVLMMLHCFLFSGTFRWYVIDNFHDCAKGYNGNNTGKHLSSNIILNPEAEKVKRIFHKNQPWWDVKRE